MAPHTATLLATTPLTTTPHTTTPHTTTPLTSTPLTSTPLTTKPSRVQRIAEPAELPRDDRALIASAAETILVRDGQTALSIRALAEQCDVPEAALVAVFPSLHDVHIALVERRMSACELSMDAFVAAAGRAPVVHTVTALLRGAFSPLTLACVTLALSKRMLRSSVGRRAPRGVPVLAQVRVGLVRYLEAELRLGRIRWGTDVESLAITLVGASHQLFSRSPRTTPSAEAVEELVVLLLEDALA